MSVSVASYPMTLGKSAAGSKEFVMIVAQKGKVAKSHRSRLLVRKGKTKVLRRLFGLKTLRSILYQIDLPYDSELNDKWNRGPHLDLGSGNVPRNPFRSKRVIACDIATKSSAEANYEYISFDLSKKIPLEAQSVETISAFDFLEHIPRWTREPNGLIRFPFVELMDEVWRVLRPGGYFYAVTPFFPSRSAFSDPTHVNFITIETVNYFLGNDAPAKLLGYGFSGNYKLVHCSFLKGFGPWESKIGAICLQDLLKNPNLFHKLRVVSILLKRSILRLFIARPTHILWILSKQP